MRTKDFYALTNQLDSKNYKSIRQALNYILVKSEDMSFGFKSDNGRFVFITGKNDFEEDLPVIQYNMLITDLEPKPIVVIDIRPYVNNKVREVETIEEMERDRISIEYKITHAFYLLKFFNKVESTFNDIILKLTSTILCSSIRSMYNMDVDSITRLQIVVLHYMLSVTTDLSEHEKIEVIKLNVVFDRVGLDYIDEVLKEVTLHPKGLVDLSENIKAVDINGSLKGISNEVILLSLSSLTSSPTIKQEIGTLLSSPAVAIATINLHYKNNFLKRAKLTQLMKPFERKVGLKEFSLRIKEELGHD